MGFVSAAVAVAGLPRLAAQVPKPPTEGSEQPSGPVPPVLDGKNATPPDPNTDTAAADRVRLERRLDELRSEILDWRERFIDWVLMFFGVVIALGGIVAFGRFRQIEKDANMHLAKAEGLVKEIKRKDKEAEGYLQRFRSIDAKYVAQAPDKARVASDRVLRDPGASAVDKAMARAVSLQRAGEEDAAIEIWRAIAVVAKGTDNNVDLAARAWFSSAYLLGGRDREALADDDEAITLEPEHAGTHLNRGVSQAKLGRYKEALADYDKAIRLEPDNARAYFNRGLSQAKLGRRKEAITDYTEAIRLKPDNARAHLNRGVSQAKLGRRKEAIADYTEAIRLKDGYARAYFNRGLSQAKLGRRKEAITDYTEAIRLKPDNARAYLNRGVSQAKLGCHDKAIADYTEAIRLKPDYARAYSNRGVSQAKLGCHDKAAADRDKAIRFKDDLKNNQN